MSVSAYVRLNELLMRGCVQWLTWLFTMVVGEVIQTEARESVAVCPAP